MMDANNIILPALSIKATTLSKTSFDTYFILGNLYSGSSDINDDEVFLNTNLDSTILDIIITIIAKKYRDAATSPLFSLKKYPEKSAIIGSLALQGINGVSIVVNFLSSLFSIILVVIIPGTEQPLPTINGIKLLPLK